MNTILKKKKESFKTEVKNRNLIEPFIPENENHVHPTFIVEIPVTSKSFFELIVIYIKFGVLCYEEIRKDKPYIKNKLASQNLLIEEQYDYLDDLTELYPGHKSTKILFIFGILKTRSVFLASILTFCFYIPSFSLLLVLTKLLFARNIFSNTNDYIEWKYYTNIFTIGLSQAALGLILNNGLVSLEKITSSSFDYFIIIISFLLHSYFDTFMDMFVIFIVVGLFTSMYSKRKTTHHHFNATIPDNFLFGRPAFLIFLGLLVGLFCLKFLFFFKFEFLDLIESFYRIGCFTITGGYSIIPLALAEFPYFQKLDFIKGYSLVSVLPGPMFNLAGYIGFLIEGVSYALIAVVVINLPGLLLCMASLRHHKHIKKYHNIRKFLFGVNLASIGFIFSAIVSLYKEVCWKNPITNLYVGTINIIICFVLFYNVRLCVPVTLLIGATLFIVYFLISNML